MQQLQMMSKKSMTTLDEPIPRPPRLGPTWETWMWIALMIAVVVLTVIGLWPDGMRWDR